MHYSLLVIILHGAHDVVDNYLGIVLGYSTAFYKVIGKWNASDKFHDDVDVVIVVHALVELDNIGMIHIHQHLQLCLKHILNLLFVILVEIL